MMYPLTLAGIDLANDPELSGDQLQWVEQFASWDPIEQNQDRTLGGALIIQEGIKLYGRPITLASNEGAWFPLSIVQQLEALRDQVGIVMPLTLQTGEQHYVTWNRAAGPAVEAVPLFRGVVYGPDDLFNITLRLITVAPPAPPAP
ncbi:MULTISPECIES: hypothetical protein [unclassified Pseudomonas]|uniref:hypothetical protein n=1 Tax=unclassified Pseudomonas TaxID=196821 RepID=UPI00244C89CE|nr:MULTISPECIES: hypothetical protein [unclassified Pseudomonas]MDG9928256.1 hypothetical protein [Pseudomonas sp. GD04042]MDH0481180.1 hypothetical protein [Pseudomonas sp. GD04015]MDH0604516.1 hypothetical protein [Pseudomonas sp. GD03869]